MADFTINQQKDLFEKKFGFVQIEDGNDKYRIEMVQVLRNSINLNSFERIHIDDQTPVFRQIADVVGDATLEFFDTADMHDTASPATNERTISYWKQQIAKGLPPSITFLETLNAPQSTGDKFDREKWTGRIIDVETETVTEGTTVRSVRLEVEITSYISDIREAT